MINAVQTIPLLNLSLSFIPVIIVLIVLWNWKLKFKNSVYAVLRMLIQLMLIGYFLAYIFEADNSLIVLVVLAVMLFSSSVIALRTINITGSVLYLVSLLNHVTKRLSIN